MKVMTYAIRDPHMTPSAVSRHVSPVRSTSLSRAMDSIRSAVIKSLIHHLGLFITRARRTT
jgi:hypothetical protein